MFEEVFARLWFSSRGRYLGLSVLALMGLLCVMTFFKMLHAWYSDFNLTQKMVAPKAIVDNDAKLITQLPEQHLFGAAPAADFLPLSSLSMRITGILQSSNGQESRVILTSEGHAGKIYKVGDYLAAGIRIAAIDATGIQVEQNGHTEKLALVRAPLVFQDKPKTIA